MAETKKVFSIQINGITESISAVSDLTKQLDELEKKIKILDKKAVNVKTTTGGSKSTSSSSGGNKSQLTEEEKLQKLITKEVEKRTAMQTKEYQELLKQKEVTKEIANEQKQISIGALEVDSEGVKEYTNTLAGMKARLAELKAETQNFDLTGWNGEIDTLPESVKNANDAIKKLSDSIKNFENTQGTFSRGVGDYFNQFKKALDESNKEINNVGKTLQSLQTKQTALKGLVNTTKLGTAEWQKYKNELDSVNAEISTLSGNPIRAEDLIDTKVTVEINGLTLQFDDLQQSISVLEDKLYQMRAAGEEGTEAFRAIQEQLVKTKQTIIDTDAEIDNMTSRTRGLDLVVGAFQGLTAAMQVGAGVAGLFGKNEEDLQKTIARVTSLMSVAQGVQELYNQLRTKGTAINKLWALSMSGAEKVIKLFSKTQQVATATTGTNTTAIAANAAATTGAATATGAATVATGALSVAMNVLKIAIASTGIGLLVVALGSLVGWMMSASDSSDAFGKSLKSLEGQISSIGNKLKTSFNNIDIATALGNQSELQGLIEKLKVIEKQYASIGKTIENIGIQQILNSGTNKWSEEAFKYGNSLNKVSKVYDDLLRSQEYGIENIDEWNDKLEDVQKSYVKLLTINLKSAADMTNQKDAMREILKITEQINNTAVGQTVENNLSKILPNESDAEALKIYLDQIKSFGNDYESIENDIRKKVAEVDKKADEDNLESLKDGLSKRLKEIKLAKERELKELQATSASITSIPGQSGAEETLAKAKQAIIAKYNKQEIEARKEAANEIKKVEQTIQSNRVSIMEEGLTKILAQIKLQRDSEIQAAKEGGIKVGELTKSINAKYDKEELKAKEEFYKKREDAFKQFAENYRQIANSFNSINYDNQTNDVKNNESKEVSSVSFDTDSKLGDSLNSQKEYYDKIIKLKLDAAEQLKNINLNQTIDNKFNDLSEENRRYEERLNIIKENNKQGLTNNEEYQQQIEQETQQHNDKIIVIEEQSALKIQEIERETINSRNEIISSGNENVIKSYSDYFNEINNLQNKAIKPNKTTGIINYADTKKNLNKVKTEYQNLLNGIYSEYKLLEKQLANNEITFNDFKTAKKELKSLEDSTKEAIENVNLTMDSLVQQVAQSIEQFVGQYLNVLGGLWSTYNDMVMNSLDYQQEMLEQEYDILEDAYSKQEELVQKHTDKLNDIEDELKDSRGDRRQRLIDQLAAEREAQINALAEEQKIQKQKDANIKKQEAVEKKRKEQEKKNAIVQATINTFTAVTNALAVQPWFVGLALSAVALGLGMANIAQIKKQKYAEGGLLNGKSHAQGGIKVGNTGIEVEGNEYIVNKKSTKANLPLIDYINSNKKTLTRDDLVSFFDDGKNSLVNKSVRKRYADGGVLPAMEDFNVKNLINIQPEQDNQVIQVQVVDIINATENVKKVQVISGL